MIISVNKAMVLNGGGPIHSNVVTKPKPMTFRKFK